MAICHFIVQKNQPSIYLLIFLLIGVITLRFTLWTFQIERLAYFNLYTFSRIDGLCIGSLLAVLSVVNYKAINRYFTFIVLGLAALNFVFYFFNKQNQFSYPYLAIAGYTTFAIIFGLLVNEGVERQDTFISKILSFRAFRFFGVISYGLYVFHWPFYLITSPALKKWAETNIEFINPSITASIIATLLSVLLALLSFHLFEKRFLALKKKFE